MKEVWRFGSITTYFGYRSSPFAIILNFIFAGFSPAGSGHQTVDTRYSRGSCSVDRPDIGGCLRCASV